MMDFCLNKSQIEKENISLKFERIISFDELLDCKLDEIIYIKDTEQEYPKIFIKNNFIKKKRKLFTKVIYFQLNDIGIEPTKVYRDDFNNCGYIFYKMEVLFHPKNALNVKEVSNGNK